MDYNTFREKLRSVKLSGKDLTTLLRVDKTTPSAYWKRKDEVPQYVDMILELLEKLPEDERVLFIHHKLKEAESGN